MNTTTQFFQDKAQYKAFRKAFAAAQNDKRAHKTFTESDIQVYDREASKYKTIKAKFRHDGWLSSAHYLLFNLVSGRDYYSGFTPKTKTVFLDCGGDADRGLNGAITQLVNIIEAASILVGKNIIPTPSWVKDKKKHAAERMQAAQNQVNAFLEPLAGTFTLQDLVRVQLPMFPGLTNEQTKEYSGKRITYREVLGPQVTDQTPDPGDEEYVQPATQPEPVATEPKKKGLLARMFGG